jgi:Tol biopolymer transport system component
MGLSRDGEWALALDPIHLERLRIIPTGVGESSSLKAPAGLHYMVATWMPDGKHIMAVASATGHAPATYVQDVTSGAVRQITHEGTYTVMIHDVVMSVSPDGQYCVTTDGGPHYWIQPMNGGEPREIKGLLEGDFPLQWHDDSQSIFFERRASLDAIDIYDLNLATGQQKIWTHFSPTDKTAMVTMRHPLITPDGAHSLYAVQRIYSTLFVAKGVH